MKELKIDRKERNKNMIKNFFTCLTSMILVAITAVPHNASVYANIANENMDYEGAPIIYVQDDDELPQSMRDNFDSCVEKNYHSMEKESAFNRYINESALKEKSSPSRVAVYPTVMGLYQCPQETNFYCGYASLQSILNYHEIYKTQQEIAQEAYVETDALAWFAGSEAQATNWRYYPAAVYLSSLLDHDYRPYSPYFGAYTEAELSQRLRYDISEAEEAVMIAGISKGSDCNGSKLPGYPTDTNISHWIVAYRITWDIDEQLTTQVYYRDPAKSEAVSWSDSISATGNTDLTRMFNFSKGHGIIW